VKRIFLSRITKWSEIESKKGMILRGGQETQHRTAFQQKESLCLQDIGREKKILNVTVIFFISIEDISQSVDLSHGQ
jgi:hypothetical protein